MDKTSTRLQKDKGYEHWLDKYQKSPDAKEIEKMYHYFTKPINNPHYHPKKGA